MNEFMQWLNKNEAHFQTYRASEIADVALACGFDRQVVAQWLTSQLFQVAA